MSTIKRYAPTAARLFLGLVFTVFGFNFFFHFLPMPPPPAGRVSTFLAGVMATGYLMQLVHAVEAAAGILLLANRFVPLALTVLAPIVVNILGFHLLVAGGGLAIPTAILVAGVYLAWTHRGAFAPMLRARAPRAATRLADQSAAAPVRHAA
jgi:uncharacterized membrane protein YphA (DoxX/SURF4 family)